ncbi:iron transporter [Novosphingobium beihaiensis]|uniref:Iron transporter n=1 Tax=Novosphingobium beihaiensis TaxID=2930389 RepID=A0ABT0BVI1_9SPHN|nr:iron transporter [Novosphingobium beihaiensis]MCJ2188821.1 iron transporter [Novosphingobium beihaiensis]
MSRRNISARYRWAVASRAAAAFLGGYALTSAATIVLALLWPVPKAQGVFAASMLSFALYAIVILWAFHCPSVKRVWTVMLIGTAGLSALAWLLNAGGAA